MTRVATDRIIIADINKRGAKAFDKVHGLEGASQKRTKMDLKEIRGILEGGGFKVKTYRHDCQTILISRKGKKR